MKAGRSTIGLLLLFCITQTFSLAAAQSPNIVLIMADDMGFSDLGCYGGEIETPCLDGLAARGVRFTQFYNTARCCPTRAALLTGVYSHQAGVGVMTDDYGFPGYRGFLNDRCVTIAEALRPAGYASLMVGKWHVGGRRGQWPLDRGFERFFGTPSGGGAYFKETLELRPFERLLSVPFLDDQTEIEPPDDLYVTETITDHALRFIEAAARDTRPFFLYVAHFAPHWPLQAKPEDIAKYDGRYDEGWDAVRAKRHRKQLELGVVSPDWPLSPRDPQAQPWAEITEDQRQDLAHRMAVYAAQVDCIDQNAGRLVAKLKEVGELENTVLVFLSDNGCSAEGGPGGFNEGLPEAPIGGGSSYASAGLEWANVCNTPFRNYKMDTHEGGIATPLIVHWPRGIPQQMQGTFLHKPGHVIDLLPTFLELAGAEIPRERSGEAVIPIEGESFAAALQGKPFQRGPLYWEHLGNRAIRVGSTKLVASHNQEWELYDLAADRTELNNLAADHPDRVSELKSQWTAWAERVGVQSWPAVRLGPGGHGAKRGQNDFPRNNK